ncbi:MAG: hypothetical protein ABI855_04540 [Bacteroidota bacterium]
MKKNLTKTLMMLIVFSSTLVKAQENEPDTLPGTVGKLAGEIKALKRS